MIAKNEINKIGILVGGGSAPGINSVIHAVTMEAYRNHCTVTGIYDGFKHLMEGNLVGIELTPEMVGYIYIWREGRFYIPPGRTQQNLLTHCANVSQPCKQLELML